MVSTDSHSGMFVSVTGWIDIPQVKGSYSNKQHPDRLTLDMVHIVYTGLESIWVFES